MAARPSVTIVCQGGVESTPGVAVACSKLFTGLDIEFTPNLQTKPYRAAGFKNATIVALERIWAKGTFKGPLDYNEICYPLAGLINGGSPAAHGSGYDWTFQPSSTAIDANKTFTFQRGDASFAQQMAYGQFDALTTKWTKASCDISGGLFAYAVDQGGTLTSSPTAITQQPVFVNQVDIYIDTTYAGIGTTKWTDAMDATFTLPAKYKEKMVLNTAFQSFKEAVEIQTEATKLTIQTEHNSQSIAIYNALTATAFPVRYIQVKNTGATISSGVTYLQKWNFAVQLLGAKELKDMDGVYGYEFDFQVEYSSSMGRAWEVFVTNTLASL